nr:E3 ubiquitin-protein ligase TRIM39-like [Labrus bergylta]
MSLHGSFLSDEQFQCSICLDVFVNPSSTPCGHSFCMACISRYWDGSKVCQCPLCKKTFQKRPDLQINRTLREITEQFKSMKGGGGMGREKRCRGGDVPNPSPVPNPPSGPPPPPPCYGRSSGRRRFTVTGAASGESIPICEIHHRGIMAQLSVSEQEIRHMIRQRIKKIEGLKKSVAEVELAVEGDTTGSVCLFSLLVSTIQRSQAELMEVMELSRRAAEHQAEVMIRQLELEVKELRSREKALAELAQLDDALQGVKAFPVLSDPPPTKDWSEVSVNTDLGTGTIYRSLAAQVESFLKELKKAAETGFPAPVLEPSSVRTQPRVRRIQEYAVDVTMDDNTAHPRLILSGDMKSVRCGDRHQLLPDNPERFDRVVCVLGRPMISSGRHYWEVEVGGKTDWDLGVAKQSINRKGKVEVTPSNGYWFLSLRDKSKYAFRTEPSTDVQMNLQPQKIGVFVDYEKGQVSFYNVDSKLHIYTFNDTFSESIFPFFSPCTNKSGKNEGPLIITRVTLTE